MKRLSKEFLALCISASFCVTSIVGCGANTSDVESVVETQIETQTVVETQSEVETENATETEIQTVINDETEVTVSDGKGIFIEPVENISDNFICGMY